MNFHKELRYKIFLFCVFPVMPDILDIFIIIQQIQHFLQPLGLIFIRQLYIAVLRKHFNLGRKECITLCRKSIGNSCDIFFRSVNGKGTLLL